ncbi:MAG: CPBP family intramembrane metalloprotease [Spirochaetaceae bacterium]|nr:CPBP family intramembrane metalloprotease [Spirochaetaceae bacterium]
MLYILLFSPDASSLQILSDTFTAPDMLFSAYESLFQVFVFYIPALAVVLYFSFQDTPDLPLKQSPRLNSLFISKLNFFLYVLFGTAILLLIGAFIVFIENLLPDPGWFGANFTLIEAPKGLFTILIMILYCVCAAYLEESFFRVFFYRRMLLSGIKKLCAVVVSAILFAACHLWEGFWGMADAFLSGIVLSFLFERKKSLNCIALSHALYNIAVYLLP